MKCLTFFLLIITLISCELSGNQEQNLNKSLGHYIVAKNQCMKSGMIAFTYPEYIKDLTEKGDSVLLDAFKCKDRWSIEDQIQRNVKNDNATIHVRYDVKMTNGAKSKESKIYAISENDGKDWFFLQKEIYEDSTFCKKMKRLINN